MTPTSSQFEDLKLITTFKGKRYTHAITEVPVRYETWIRVKTLGKGTSGTVYKEISAERARGRDRGVRAVKQIKKSSVRWGEMLILAQLRSYPEHFVQLTGWFENENHIYLAMEYLSGDLDALLNNRNLSEDDTKRVTKQILVGLDIMHKKGICHRDLKPSNILIAQRIPLSIKIADFGVAKHLDNTECRTTIGTRPFMAPEIWKFNDEDTSVYTTAVDIWSSGCLVYLMLTKVLPFPETRDLLNFVEGRSPFPPSTARGLAPPAIQLITSMLQPLPQDRPPASKAQLHPWLLFNQPPCDPSQSTSGDPPPANVKRNLTPLGTPGLNKQPQLSDLEVRGGMLPPRVTHGPKKPSQRDSIQYLLVAAAASGNCETLIEALVKGARPMDDPSGSGDTPIYQAAKKGHLPVIKLLLKHGAHLGVEGKRQVSALHGAAEGGNLQVVQYLLERGADLSVKTKAGFTALGMAAEFGSVDVLKFLVEKGADISGRCGAAGRTALLSAAYNGHLHIVRYLLDNGADICANLLNSAGQNALHLAAEGNHPKVAGLLLERGADLSAISKEGATALHCAAQFGSIDVLKLLVEKGVDILGRCGAAGWTALLSAAYNGHLHIVRYLLDNGGDICTNLLNSAGQNALHLAAEGNHPKVAGLLLERGADLSAISKEGATALHCAAQFGSIDVLKLLVEKGADISGRCGAAGWTALLSAAYNGHLHIVRYLLDNGADICANLLNSAGQNALHLAAEGNHRKVAGLLLERGADLSAISKEGATALHCAAQFGSIDVLKLLVEKGADILGRCGAAGWTALLSAAYNGHLHNVRYLLDNGADLSAKKLDYGADALQLAAVNGHLEVARLLLERGASTASTTNQGETALSLAAIGGHIDTVRELTKWSERDVTIPSARLASGNLPEPPMQEPIQTSDAGSTASDSTTESPESIF